MTFEDPVVFYFIYEVAGGSDGATFTDRIPDIYLVFMSISSLKCARKDISKKAPCDSEPLVHTKTRWSMTIVSDILIAISPNIVIQMPDNVFSPRFNFQIKDTNLFFLQKNIMDNVLFCITIDKWMMHDISKAGFYLPRFVALPPKVSPISTSHIATTFPFETPLHASSSRRYPEVSYWKTGKTIPMPPESASISFGYFVPQFGKKRTFVPYSK